MVFALIPVILVVVVVVVLMVRKGGKSAASEPTSWPTPESNRPGPSTFSDMSRDAATPLTPTTRPAKERAAAEAPRPASADAAGAAAPPADTPAARTPADTPDAADAPPTASAPPVSVPPVSVPPVSAPPVSVPPVSAPEPKVPAAAEAPADPVDDDPADTEDEPVVEEPDLSRFGIPSERKVVAPLQMPKAQVRHLELPPLDAGAGTDAGTDAGAGADGDARAGTDAGADSDVDGDARAGTDADADDDGRADEPAGTGADADPVVEVAGASELRDLEPPVDEDPMAEAGGLEFEDATLSLEFDDLDDPGSVEVDPDETVVDVARIDAETELDPDETVVDVARIDAEAELDRVIGALIDRARATDQSVVEVATELVERANLDEKEATDTLATLMDGDDTTDIVDIAGRLSELTLFNELVPSKPGALTQFGDLDPLTRKRVIVRVLCLLVAKSESDLKSLPKNPASAAETRQWPLARAVWPVPAKKPDAKDADLPNRDFGVRR
jgi:hypothetical protein